MLQELSDILQDKVHPAIYDGIEAIVQSLEKYKAVGYKDRILLLRMNANNRETITLCDEAIGLVYAQVRALLAQMQVTLELDTLPMEKLAGILDCLVFAPSDNDYEFLTAVNAGEDSVDTFCNILAIYMACEPEEVMEYIVNVTGDVILAIKEKVEQNLNYTDQGEEGVQSTVRLMNKLQKVVGEKLTVGMESLQGGMAVGGSAEEMFKAARERLADLQPEDLADQVLSIVILAGTSSDAIVDETMFFIESMIDDPFVVQKAYKRAVARLKFLQENAS
ncbi:hypothetical protein D3C78_302050 [compost metagenome]